MAATQAIYGPPDVILFVPNFVGVPVNYPFSARLGSFLASDSSNRGPFTIDVNWGDGTPDAVFAPTPLRVIKAPERTFSQEGVFHATIIVIDTSNNVSTSAPTNIDVVPVSMPRSAVPDQTVVVGNTKIFDIGTLNSSLVNNPQTVIDWGDGTSDNPYYRADTDAHIYDVSGNYRVTINDTESTGAVHTTTTFQVAVTTGADASTSNLSVSSTTVFRDYPITLSLTIAPDTATGPVRFYANGLLIGQAAASLGLATFSTNALSPGLENISAKYSGSAALLPSESSVTSVNVIAPKYETSLALSEEVANIAVDQSLHLTAAISPGTTGSDISGGTVSFSSAGALLGTANVINGVADFTTNTSLPIGTNIITARYGGDGTFSISDSNDVSVTVAKAVTTYVLSPQGTHKTPYQSLHYVAIVKSTTPEATRLPLVYPNTSAELTDTAGAFLGIGSIGADGTASIDTQQPNVTGYTTVMGTYLGDNRFEASTSAPFTIEVNTKAITATVVRLNVPHWFATGQTPHGSVVVKVTNDLSIIDAGPAHGAGHASRVCPCALRIHDDPGKLSVDRRGH